MRRKIMVSLLVIAVTALMVGGASLAIFTSTATNPTNTFAAGTLVIDSTGTTETSVNILNMKPGDTVTVTMGVASLGTLPLNYTITPVLTGAIAGGVSPAVVSGIRVDGIPTASNSLAAFDATSPEPDLIDDEDVVEIDITLPVDADDDYQGLAGNLAVTFDAIQQ
ncbi:MAG: TasA family protein [Actinomycetota bacterium]|nr:TasA family protein [Actinomycetota bacterium]